MRHGNSGKWTMATILIAGFCLMSMGSSVDAGWGHHRHFHRHHFGWPSYRSYGFYGSYSFARHHIYRPSYYYSYFPRYYAAPRYYVTPYVNYGCYSYPSWYGVGYGYGGFYSANSVSAVTNAYAQTDDRSNLGAKPEVDRSLPFQVQPNTIDALAIDRKIDQPAASERLQLKVNVPEDARVTINGRLTSASGSEREYVFPGAQLEDQYELVIRAEVERDGQTKTETKRVVMRGGQLSSLAFDLDADATQVASVDGPVKTSVTLRVPDEAKVYLAGVEMKQQGGTRVFETTNLRPGEERENYTVRVTLASNGEAESRVKQLTLVGGEAQEVEFDFAPPRLAAR